VGLDLDGTLIDTKARHMTALRQAAEALGVSLTPAFPAVYYEQKRSGASGKEVLLQNQIAKAEEIAAAWVRIIEEESLLALDSPFPLVFEKMRELISEDIELFICTARQHSDRVICQIGQLGFAPLIKQVFVAKPRDKSSPGDTKSQLTRQLHLQAVIGDSEVDLEWAAKLGAKFIAVDCGLRSQDFWTARDMTPHGTTASAFDAIRSVLRMSL
jgi:phosphoglycolate phosphatase-like HAD superfamily hydrolase